MTTETTLPGDPAEPGPQNATGTAPSTASSAQPEAHAGIADLSNPAGQTATATLAAPSIEHPPPTNTAAPAYASASASAPVDAFVSPSGTGFTAIDATTFDAAAVLAAQAQSAEAAARRARRRRNAMRWSAAAVLMLAVGGGTAYALTLPQRTDIPGLHTASDGRYEFPTLTVPALPAEPPAADAPTDNASLNGGAEHSDAKQHLADIRKLLLPRPAGATAQPASGQTASGQTTKGETTAAQSGGWLADPSKLFIVQDTKTIFTQYGLRHTATESWKTPDGATTTIDLLQFSDNTAAAGAHTALADGNLTAQDETALSAALAGVPKDTTAQDLSLLSNGIPATYSIARSGGTTTRYGAFISGDTIALVIESGPAAIPLTPFQQVMTLQAEMLQ